MNVTAEQLAHSRGVSLRTAQRWLRRIQRAEPHLVREIPVSGARHRLEADAKKIARWVPPPRRFLVGKNEHERTLAQVRDFQRRLDVEVRERLALADRVAQLEKQARHLGFQAT
jgi:primosomal protein N''